MHYPTSVKIFWKYLTIACAVDYTWGDEESLLTGFGMAALPNCLYPLVNVFFREMHEVDYYFRAKHNFTFKEDPGFGATTVHYTRSGGKALHLIEAGSEIFIDYGEGYFEAEHRIKHKFGLIPYDRHFVMADALLHAFRIVHNNIVDENFRRNAFESNGVDNSDFSMDLYEMTSSVLRIWPNRVLAALPSDVNGINHVLDTLGSTSETNFKRSIRPIEDLKKHGTCMNHMSIGESTIPFAGKGAFANKFLPNGTVVAPLPLLHMPRSSLYVYSDDGNDGDDPNSNQSMIHHELYLNYCFGHHESSVLLCPYGIGSSLVNHAGQEKQPNIRLQWSMKHTREPEWFNLPLHQWMGQHHGALAMEFIAIRDIQEGEEILLDYGMQWQRSWDEHVHAYYNKFLAFNGTDDGYVYDDITAIHPWTFRHEIQVPDHVMPDLWKDLRM
jgi:SET domain